MVSRVAYGSAIGMKPSRIAPLMIWLLISVAVTVAAYRWTYDKALEGIRSKGTRQLEIYALDLQSALDKFETLPYVLSLHPDVVRALQSAADRGASDVLNDYLQAVQQQANVAAIYAAESSGNTLAASNWNTPQSFVGSNYGFRPYFQDAMHAQVGRFYGIGSTTAEPGYFLAHPVYPRRPVAHAPLGTPIGVIAIKISLDEFEAAWRASDEPIALADANGVVFLSSVPSWKYHSLTPLGAPALMVMEQTQQYVGKAITPLALPARGGVYEDYVERSVGPLGWRLLLFTKAGPAQNAAWNSAIACLLAAIIGGLPEAVFESEIFGTFHVPDDRLRKRRALGCPTYSSNFGKEDLMPC